MCGWPVRYAYLRQVRDAEHKANRVQNVALARAVEARDGVELLVEARDDGSRRIRLEAVDHDLLDEH